MIGRSRDHDVTIRSLVTSLYISSLCISLLDFMIDITILYLSLPKVFLFLFFSSGANGYIINSSIWYFINTLSALALLLVFFFLAMS